MDTGLKKKTRKRGGGWIWEDLVEGEYGSERGEETMGSQGIEGVPRKPNKILIRKFERFTSTDGFNRTIPIS